MSSPEFPGPGVDLSIDWKVQTIDLPSTGRREYRFPKIHIADGAYWEAHHSVSDATEMIDGHISRRPLDIWFVDGTIEDKTVIRKYPTLPAEAHAVWEAGNVLAAQLWGAPNLLIPGKHFTEVSILEAFHRFMLRQVKDKDDIAPLI